MGQSDPGSRDTGGHHVIVREPPSPRGHVMDTDSEQNGEGGRQPSVLGQHKVWQIHRVTHTGFSGLHIRGDVDVGQTAHRRKTKSLYIKRWEKKNKFSVTLSQLEKLMLFDWSAACRAYSCIVDTCHSQILKRIILKLNSSSIALLTTCIS